jgi:hypothetical protein
MLSFKKFIEESKEYKAQEGESEVLHHLSPYKFAGTDFRPLSHFGTANASRDLVRNRKMSGDLGTGDEVHHHAVRIKLGKVAHLPDFEGDHTPHDLNNMLLRAGHITQQQHQQNKVLKGDLTFKHVAKSLRKNGIHTLSYENVFEDPGSTSYMITHHSQVRPLRSSKGAARVNPNK